MEESNKTNSTLWVKQSLRLLHHELRRGELTIIILAIVLAVATVFSLAGFSSQIQQALITNSASYIAADRVLQTTRNIAPSILDKSNEYSLKQAQKLETESMVFAGENMLLAELNAVSQFYPLRGELKVKTDKQQESTLVHAPKKGSVWVEESVLGRLEITLGQSLEIGSAEFIVSGIITDIPDRSYKAMIIGPTIILNINDLPATELIQPGSRATYKYLFIGSLDNIKAFEQWLKPQLNDSQYWYDAKTAQSRLSNTLGTAEKFLSLASMLGIVLAAVAVSVASRRYGQRHQPMVAVFKALGASLSHIKKLYYLHWSLLSLLSILIGLVIGYLLLLLGNQAIEQYLSLENIAIGSGPFIVAILTGIICAFSFALHPLHQLISTSPLAVIRGFSLDKSKHFGWHQFPPLLALFVLLMVFSRDLTMSLSLLIAGSLVAGVLLFFGRMLMSAGRVVGSKAGKSWHLALANLKRRASENSVQLVSFTIAIQLLLLIVVVKNSILEQWQAQLPKDTPNHYVVNIAKQQLLPLEMFVQKSAIKTKGFYPVVRGRLSLINNEKVQDLKNVIQAEKNQQKKDGNENQEQRRQGVGRELGLTWRQDLPFDNTLLEGLWWQKGDELKQVSIEGRMADKLAIKLGDRLTFDIGGELITAPVTNIRKVNWQNRQLNFIMIFNPAALKHFSTTYVSAWMVPADEKQAISGFLKDYPTITVMDFGAILKQLHKVIEQVSIAIELILILVILAGSLVLVAQVQASMEERERELAILRTLGAKGSLLRNSVLFEFVALGAIAGFMASLAMEVAVYMLQTRIFDMSPSFHFSYWLLGIGAGGAFVGLIGLISCWRLLNLSSITLIRRTM